MKAASVVIPFALLFAEVCCSPNPPADPAPLKAPNRIVYVAAKGIEGTKGGRFGDIVVQDMDSRQRFSVTSDDYYDDFPHWSPDGMKIVFVSARETADRQRTLLGVSARVHLFVFDINTMMVKRIGGALERELGDEFTATLTLENFCWWHTADTLLVANDNMLLKYVVSTDSVIPVRWFSKFVSLFFLTPNKDFTRVAFEFSLADTSGAGIATWDPERDCLAIVTQPQEFLAMKGWSCDGDTLLFISSSPRSVYSVRSGAVTDQNLEPRLDQTRQYSQDVFYSKGMVLSRSWSIPGNRVAVDLYLYEYPNGKMVQLTDDNLEKDRVDVFEKSGAGK